MASGVDRQLVADVERAVCDRDGRKQGSEIRFRCPYPGHTDEHPSCLFNPAKEVFHCPVCGKGGGVYELAKLLGIRGNGRGGEGVSYSRKSFEHSNPSETGLTLAQYAEAKRLPIAFLESLGLSNLHYGGRPAVRMPYLNADGTEAAVKFRLAMEGATRSKWRKDSKPILHGLNRLAEAKEAGYIVMVEGESDCQTLWHHGIPAVGLPGAGTWREAWAEHLADIPIIYVVIEPDAGGESVKKWLATSSIRERARLMSLGEFKDPSALHIADPAVFNDAWQQAIESAVAWTQLRQAELSEEAATAYEMSKHLLHDPDLLDRVGKAMSARGYAGDLRPPKMVYIAMTTRNLARPINLALVAPSAAGKNRAVDAALQVHPVDAIYIEKAGSARALVYSDASYEHRVIVVAEADSIPDDGPAAAAVRAVAEDNCMAYDVVERNEATGEHCVRHIVKPGPTSLITTSTKSVRNQLGTRMLEITVSDDVAQTREVLKAHASGVMPKRAEVDLGPYIAMQTYLEVAGVKDVAVPFAEVLAELVPAGAIRMRRDFRQLLTCIQGVAFLYQLQRGTTPEGWIEATLDDYDIARDLLLPIFDSVAADGMTPAIRETVEAILPGEEISEAALASRLRMAKSSISYRVGKALAGGWLKDNETANTRERRRKPLKLARGLPLPEVVSALPPVEAVRAMFECSNKNGRKIPPPPPSNGQPIEKPQPSPRPGYLVRAIEGMGGDGADKPDSLVSEVI